MFKNVYRAIPDSIQNSIRSVIPLSVKRYLGKRVLEKACADDEGDRIVKSASGLKFTLIPDRLFLRLYLDGGYEPDYTRIACALVAPGDTVVDVGSNFGWYSVCLADVVGTSGKVYGFEPSSRLFNVFCENLRLNSFEGTVKAVRACVGAEPGIAMLSRSDDSESGLNHIVDASQGGEDVEMTTLDSALDSELGEIAYLKIDVEGRARGPCFGRKYIEIAGSDPFLCGNAGYDKGGKNLPRNFLLGATGVDPR